MRKLATLVSYITTGALIFAALRHGFRPLDSNAPASVVVVECKPPAVEASPLPKPLRAHVFLENGLLEVNSDGRHPIYDLIATAERAWAKKHSKASKTLSAAVAEYKRRYKRDPPTGFDKWWEYVQQHRVSLPDEYDQIYRDLERYWGMNPADLRQLHADLEQRSKDFTTLVKAAGAHLTVDNSRDDQASAHEPVWHVLDLLADVEEHLPPFRAIFTHDDRPNRLKSFEIEQVLIQAASNGKELRTADIPRADRPGWVEACNSESAATLLKLDLDNPPNPSHLKTFIHDHHLVMDPCLHPSLLWQHGQFVSHEYGPYPQPHMIPEFAWCSTALHHDIRVPTLYGFAETTEGDPKWENKIDERLVWRGGTTGIGYHDHVRWRGAHRTVLVEKTNIIAGTVRVLNSTSKHERVGDAITIRNAFLSPSMFDVGFTGEPDCSGSVCQYLEENCPPKNRQTDKDTWRYKYIIDVDGNGWSGRFRRLMSSNSLVFKSTIYPEWYVDRVQPWLHYVPVQVGLEDLHDAVMFFRGGPDGKGAHDELGKKLASEGKRWTQEYWRREDLVAYLFRLFLEYGRVMNVDRNEMSFVL